MKKIIFIYQTARIGFEFSFLFFAAHYVIYLQSFGLNLLQVNAVNAIFMTGILIMEIPTGVIADLVSRKKSYLIGLWLKSAGFFGYFLASSFAGFIISELILAAGACFISGALEAWLVDELRKKGDDFSLTYIFSDTEYKATIAQIFGGGAGGILATFNPELPWLTGAILLAFLAIVMTAVMPTDSNPLKSTAKEKRQLFISYLQEGIKIGYHHKLLRRLFVLLAISAFSWQPINMFWQPLFKSSWGILSLGFIWMAIKITIALANKAAGKIIERIEVAIYWSLLQSAVAIFLLTFINNLPLVLSLFIFHEIGRGLFSPLKKSLINQQITAHHIRATILSLESMLTKIGAALGLIISGLIGKNNGIIFSWKIFSALLIITSTYFLYHYHQTRN